MGVELILFKPSVGHSECAHQVILTLLQSRLYQLHAQVKNITVALKALY